MPETVAQRLIETAYRLVAGWRQRRTPRRAWHRADDLLMAAARLDEGAAMPHWQALAEAYEEWVQSASGV